ncbi:hypothetical protein JCM17845_08280 [Iodidimonas gelatinilytica]|uniref:Nucleotidyl transferase domain-containing protein n=1 Tax=Iodidimonas gelatinilytica TaxID=1236966 RepID=A0A5A7MXQ4_9PROT|nr:sugar phosphate nucleotidyltransferase [Iodidimonas gelatinilytica]GER00205.1 hypothetical protein JCM17845_08280 [Iodidimonas gelatinilytica]
MRLWPVILSGGSGTRLWPLSRAFHPKQFLPVLTDLAMIQETALRLSDPQRFAPPLLIANDDHRFMVSEKMLEIGIDPLAIILEPIGKGTAPAAIMAALRIAQEDENGLILLAPSDHSITDPDAFQQAIETAIPAAESGQIITFGISANYPETGYGYIEAGQEVTGQDGVYHVENFHEKPDLAGAKHYLEQENFFWNSGIFLFRCDSMIQAFETFAPEILSACKAALEQVDVDLGFERPNSEAFQKSPADSIDCAIMEKADNIAVVPVDMGWSDLGSWAAMWNEGSKDDQATA